MPPPQHADLPSTTRLGAIAQWHGGEDSAYGDGHVAYVESVNPSGSAHISEYNLSEDEDDTFATALES